MRAVALLAIGAILAACGGDSNGPIDTQGNLFGGSWSGNAYYAPYSADTLHFSFAATQSAGTVSGRVTYRAPFADTATFTGTSAPPTLDFAANGGNGYTYNGTYVTTDSLAGTMDINGLSDNALSLKKNSDASGGAFSGMWSGFDPADSLQYAVNASENGSAVAGMLIVSSNGAVLQNRNFTGTATPPAISFVWTSYSASLRYTGTYINIDSIAGTLRINGVDDVPLSLKRN